MAGTLTLPSKNGNYPAVILISGSGPQNRDEELFGHKPFLILSDFLTKNGIAVFRFDDRGVGNSEGDFKSATLKDFAGDVEAALKYLKTRKEINNKKIGLIGHSEGGIIAPMVAAKTEDVNFIVLMAGTGIQGNKLLLLQQEMIANATNLNLDEVKKSLQINEDAFDVVIKSVSVEQLKTNLATYVQKIPAADLPIALDRDKLENMLIAQLSSPWIQDFLKHDPSVILQKVKCPVLAINGEKDVQVPSKINLEAIKNALEKGKNKKIKTKEFPNLNHLFQECKTGTIEEYSKIEQTISPVVLTEITNWIKSQL